MNRLTKIVCTLGPATDTPEMVKSLAAAGANIIRFNFSHENHTHHRKNMEMVRKTSDEIDANLAIMLDTKGPEIRCGVFKNGFEMYKKGELVKVCKQEMEGTHEMFHIQ